eukprot:125421_1
MCEDCLEQSSCSDCDFFIVVLLLPFAIIWGVLCVPYLLGKACCESNDHNESTNNDETHNTTFKAKEKRNNPTFYDATIKEINDGSVKVGHDGYPAKYDPCITKSKLKTHITINVNN